MTTLTDHVVFHDRALERKYASARIPMATLYEAYFEGAIGENGKTRNVDPPSCRKHPITSRLGLGATGRPAVKAEGRPAGASRVNDVGGRDAGRGGCMRHGRSAFDMGDPMVEAAAYITSLARPIAGDCTHGRTRAWLPLACATATKAILSRLGSANRQR